MHASRPPSRRGRGTAAGAVGRGDLEGDHPVGTVKARIDVEADSNGTVLPRSRSSAGSWATLSAYLDTATVSSSWWEMVRPSRSSSARRTSSISLRRWENSRLAALSTPATSQVPSGRRHRPGPRSRRSPSVLRRWRALLRRERGGTALGRRPRTPLSSSTTALAITLWKWGRSALGSLSRADVADAASSLSDATVSPRRRVTDACRIRGMTDRPLIRIERVRPKFVADGVHRRVSADQPDRLLDSPFCAIEPDSCHRVAFGAQRSRPGRPAVSGSRRSRRDNGRAGLASDRFDCGFSPATQDDARIEPETHRTRAGWGDRAVGRRPSH